MTRAALRFARVPQKTAHGESPLEARIEEPIPKMLFAKYETGSRQHLGGLGWLVAAKLLVGIADSRRTCLIFARHLHSSRTGLPFLIYLRL
jgi:hypothetical protein